jgi:hypothetical protein
MNKTLCTIVLFVFSTICLKSQNYPEVILPFSNKTIMSENDTLWVLKESQLKNALLSAKKLAIEEEINRELKKKVSLLEVQNTVNDSLVMDLKKDRDFYIAYWNTCKDDIDLLLRKHQRQKFFLRLSFAGIAVAFVAGFLIGR